MVEAREAALRIHRLLEPLPLRRNPFRERQLIPPAGLSFYYQKGEFVEIGRARLPRIVRVGSGGRSGRLEEALIGHHGGASHNVSSFRLELGAALLKRSSPEHALLAPWERKTPPRPPEIKHEDYVRLQILERRISDLLEESFQWRTLGIADDAERKALEEGILVTLATAGFPASSVWLGKHSPEPKIRETGLWNDKVPKGAVVTDDQLRRLEVLVGEELKRADAASRVEE